METLPETPAETDVADQTRQPEMAIIGLGRMGGGMIKDSVTEGADAYERLIGDAIDGDPRLFARGDTVEASWRIV